MKKLALLLLLIPAPIFAQNTRFDYSALTTTGSGNLVPVLAIPGAAISFYTGCTALPCSVFANVYPTLSSVTPCPTGTQVVLQLSTACVATADGQGNFGGWFLAGQYEYTITALGSTFGPYAFTIASGGGSDSGTVTSVSVGNLTQPNTETIFTTTVTDPSTDASIAFNLTTQPPDQFLGGSCNGATQGPGFRVLCTSDLANAIFVASGVSHSLGAVPDPGATAGTTRFLREDATWQAVTLGGTCPATTFSATPTFNFTAASCTALTLTGNVTSSSVTGFTFGVVYQVVLPQDGTGGRTFVPPSQFKGWPSDINRAASGKTICSLLAFTDGNLYVQRCAWTN